MNEATDINYWKEINGGPRTSTLLALSGILIWLSTSLYITDNLLFHFKGIDSDVLFRVAWSSWIAALLVVSAAFCLLGYRPYMSRFAWLPGIFHFGQAVDLFMALFTRPDAAMPIDGISLGKYITLIIFAFAERNVIGKRMGWILGLVAGLEIVKIIAAVVFEPKQPLSFMLDVVLLVVLGWAIYRLRHSVYDQEEHWAKKRLNERSASFEDFNNP